MAMRAWDCLAHGWKNDWTRHGTTKLIFGDSYEKEEEELGKMLSQMSEEEYVAYFSKFQNTLREVNQEVENLAVYNVCSLANHYGFCIKEIYLCDTPTDVENLKKEKPCFPVWAYPLSIHETFAKYWENAKISKERLSKIEENLMAPLHKVRREITEKECERWKRDRLFHAIYAGDVCYEKVAKHVYCKYKEGVEFPEMVDKAISRYFGFLRSCYAVYYLDDYLFAICFNPSKD